MNSGPVPHAGTDKLQPSSLNYACPLSLPPNLSVTHTHKVCGRNSDCVSVKGRCETQGEIGDGQREMTKDKRIDEKEESGA